MTPGARIAAAIEILDAWQDGKAAEQALTSWARRSRFAGSKDRAAIRDLVFDCLRNLRTDTLASGAIWGQQTSGRALMIGVCLRMGTDFDTMFSGEGHAPHALSAKEKQALCAPDPAIMNLPDWLTDKFQNALGEKAEEQMNLLNDRAPVSIRTNTQQVSTYDLAANLSENDIETRANPLSRAALTVMSNPRRLGQTQAFSDGLFELQDASSQAVVDRLKTDDAKTVLDFCAGGGGKSLALAAKTGLAIDAHDIDPRRMSDIPSRAKRAGARIRVLKPENLKSGEGYDLVFADAPCSGSGAWRRAPEGKWHLSPERLETLTDMQRDVLKTAAQFVSPDGVLAYATCSVLIEENDQQADWFLKTNPEWTQLDRTSWPISHDGDGFFLVQFSRKQLNYK